MNPATTTMPISSEPGSTRRPSSVNTAQVGPSSNLAVCCGASFTLTELPSPTASDEPNESNSTACGMCRSKPCLLSWLHITPDEVMASTDDRSYRPGLASRCCSIGPANASPTMTIELAWFRSTSAHSAPASKCRDGSTTTL